MSFRKFGGTNKLEKNNNITAHSIVADNFTIRNAFLSVFTVDGDLKINGNGFISKSIIANVSLQTATLDVSLNATIDGNLYLDKQGTTFLNGLSGMIGLNKSVPTATLDISSNQIKSLNIKSSKDENRNIIARNMWNHGIAVDVAGNTLAAIQFYSGTNNIDLSNNSNAKISYENVGNILVINSDGGTKITSNLIIADSDSVSNEHTLYDETVLIYDKQHANSTYFIESYGQTAVKTGSAVTIQAIDNYSNTYMNIVAPNRQGLNIGGGVYPKDTTRSMGIIDVYNPVTGSLNDDVATPAQIIISGNTFTKFNATTGFNTFNPDYNKYAVDINGPVHLNNGEIKMTSITSNRITQILSVNSQTKLFAIGGIDGVSAPANRKYIYESSDDGKTWSILPKSIDTVPVLLTNTGIILKMYATSNTIVVIGSEGGFTTISTNSGIDWFPLIAPTGITNIQSAYIDGLNLCIGSNDGIITIGSIILSSGSYNFISEPPTQYTQIQSARSSASDSITDSAYCIPVNRLFFVGGKYIYSYSVDGGGTILSGFTTITSSESTALYKKIKFNGSNGIAVGTDIISYTTDSGTTWADYSIAGVTLKDVHILGSNSQAIVVGNGGKIYYTSNTGYSVWTLITYDVINSSGIGSTIIDSTNDITSINMPDSSTIILSIQKNNDGGAYKSKLYYLNMPNIFNRSENHILDISGCIHTSGDIHISENGKLISNNAEFYMVNETVGNLYLAGDAELIKIGSTNTGNIIIGGNNTLTKLGPLVIGNLYEGNVRIDNNLITGNLYTTGISNIGNVTANNIIAGNLTLSGVEIINNTTSSTSTNSGALVVYGGVGIRGNLFTSGKIATTSASTPFTTGGAVDTYISGEGPITALNGRSVFGGLQITQNSNFEKAVVFQGDVQILGSLTPATVLAAATITSPWHGNSTNDVTLNDPWVIGATQVALSTDGGFAVAKRSLLIGNVRIQGIFNEIYSTTESNDTNSGALVISGGVGIGKNANIGGAAVINSTIESTTTATGALQILGGVGIGKNVNIGGAAVINSTIESTTTATGALRILGGIGIGKNANIGGAAVINSTIESTTTATGALQILGGVGIAKNVNIGGAAVINSTIESTTTATGALQILGGVGIGKNVNIGGAAVINSTIESTTTATGALQILGGVGIGKNANIGGAAVINSTIESTTTATGALQILGGVGIGKNANIGGAAMINSTIESTTTATGALQILGGVGIGKNANIGGTAMINSTIESTTTATGALQILGGVGIGKNVNVGGAAVINSTTDSTTTAAGALRILGGIGIRGNANIGGDTVIYSTTESATTSTGALRILGGATIGKNTHIGGDTDIYSTTESTTTATGALQILGGVGIAKNAHIGGNTVIYSTADSNNTGVGALQILGGVGIKGNICIGGATQMVSVSASSLSVINNITCNKLISTSSDTADSITNGAVIISGGIGLVGSIHAGGNVVVYSTIDSSSTGSGALVVAGGIGIRGNTQIGGITIIYSTIDSNSNSTGALRISGGASVTRNLYVGSSLFITSGLSVGTAATVTGSLVVSQSATVAGDLRVAGTNVVQQQSVIGSATIAGGLSVAGSTTLQATTVAGAFNIGSAGVTSTMNGSILITGTATSNTTNSGALIIRGGLGVNGTVTALAFNAVSDVRTKTNINDLSNSGLETLRKLKPKEFSYIDGARDSVYGFIAQEIKDVIPKSVIIQPNYIPSIYEYAIVHVHADKNKITLINKNTSDMAGRKLKMHDMQNNEIIVNVMEVVDDKTFIIDKEISARLTHIDIDGNRLETKTIDGVVKYFKGSQEYDGEVQKGIFIYGIYVEDFHVLNKDTIWTVALIATQEMDTQLQEARQNIKTLEDRIMEIERRFS
jgi:serine acetyltransferase